MTLAGCLSRQLSSCTLYEACVGAAVVLQGAKSEGQPRAVDDRVDEKKGDGVSDGSFAWRGGRSGGGRDCPVESPPARKALSDFLLAPMYLTGTLSTSFSSVCLPGFRVRSSGPSAEIVARLHAGVKLRAVVRLVGLGDVIERSRA